jgi:DNA-binding MarR family transcriptional regulator
LKLARCPRSLGAARRAFAFYLGNPFSSVPYSFSDFLMRFRETIPVDDYVLDVLMRDLVGHDQQPAAYLVYLYLYGQAARKKWKPVTASLRTLADATGLSKSAIQTALGTLQRRELIVTTRDHATATSRHRVLRHWRK